MIRAIAFGLAVSLAAGVLFWLAVPVAPTEKQRGVAASETIAFQTLPRISMQDAVARIEATNLWGNTKAGGEAPKAVGKIVGAVRTREEKYLLLQLDKQVALQLKIGDTLPDAIAPFAGATIVDIQSERIVVVKNGKKFTIPVTN